MQTSTATPDLSDEAIRQGSGKTWAEWVEILDTWGAADKQHKEIARYVSDLGVDGWWAQGVTVGYERIKELRTQANAAMVTSRAAPARRSRFRWNVSTWSGPTNPNGTGGWNRER